MAMADTKRAPDIDLVKRLRNEVYWHASEIIGRTPDNLMREAADEIEAMRERIEELKPYEVVSGDTWKARVAHEKIEEQAAQIKLLTHTIDTLNARIKGLQAKIKEYQTPTQSSPELEGVRG